MGVQLIIVLMFIKMLTAIESNWNQLLSKVFTIHFSKRIEGLLFVLKLYKYP